MKPFRILSTMVLLTMIAAAQMPTGVLAAPVAAEASLPGPAAPPKAVSANAASQVIDDKAAFLAATGAANATGPLPDLGVVADPDNPTGSAAVGSVTFSLAAGGESLAIGASGTGAAPDWYTPTPGNDIALGYENLRLQTAAPVFALGFEVVEPDATMPAWGGAPVDSPLRITLYNGEIVVGEFIFNPPDDVVAFAGVWSEIAFDAVEIVDTTGSDDDEYFGAVYTGTTPAPLTTRDPSDDVYVALSDGSRFVGTGQRWSDYFCTGQEICRVGDVNGDGRDDVLAFVRTNNGPNDSDVWVALSNGSRFFAPLKWSDYFCTLEEICVVGDVNGDGLDDALAFVRTNHGANDSDLWVALSNGAGFEPAAKWADYFCTLEEICAVGDVNGDGLVDALAFVRTNHGAGDSDVWVALSNGAGFEPAAKWADYFCTLEEICAVGDFDGNGQDDVAAFVRTSHGANDSDVWVALAGEAAFGTGQKWHDYFCTLAEVCGVGDFNGDGLDDVAAFVRTRLPEPPPIPPPNPPPPTPVHTINVSISLHWLAVNDALRAQYTAIFEHFADAIYEMTNGAHRVGTITVYLYGGQRDTADVVWGPNAWPNSPASGITVAGEHVTMGDTFTFPNPVNALDPANARGAGYTLAHEFGHYYYGLFDEYQGTAGCIIFARPTDPWFCDVPVNNSVMNSQWNASNVTPSNWTWLNFSIGQNQTFMNANYRVHNASGWEVLARHPWFDPRNGLQSNDPPRRFYPELLAVAPGTNQPASVEMSNPAAAAAARSGLNVVWVNYNAASAPAFSAGTSHYTASLTSLSGPGVLYPEAARLVANLARDGQHIAQADVSAVVTNPDASTAPLVFSDDGTAPDAEAGDGLYSALVPYNQPGRYHVDVTFSNASGLAEFTYLRQHFTPGPNGEAYQPQPSPVGEDFNQSAGLDLMVSGFPSGGPAPATQVTVDNFNYPGRIDAPGDQDSFTFMAEHTGEVVLRVTDLAFGLQPRIRLYQGDPAVLVGDYTFVPQGNAYFFTRLNAQAGDVFLAEVQAADPGAAGGLFNLSVGPALATPVERLTRHVYLPIVPR